MFGILTPDAITAAGIVAKAVHTQTVAIDKQTAAIYRLIEVFITIGVQMDEAMKKLTDQVTATTAVQASVVVLLQGIVAELRQHSGEADKVNALADTLAASTAALSDAVTANTPADPA